MPVPAAILALIAGAAGWYYLFYSKAARRLDTIEGSATNVRRTKLRRINGAAMVILAAGFYSGFAIDGEVHRKAFAVIWFSVFLLLLVIVILAVVDLRLTARLRRKP